MIILEDKKYKFRTEDWVCTDPLCGNVNYHWRKVCNKCKKSRDEHVPPLVKVIGKNAAEKSEGIFKSEDWQCKACGNVNWARRQQCNRCFTNKFDLINMISPDEVVDDDNLSIHSSMSALASPPVCDIDSGIGSENEGNLGNGLSNLSLRNGLFNGFGQAIKNLQKLFKLSGIYEDVMNDVTPDQKEKIEAAFLAVFVAALAESSVPEPTENQSTEDTIKELLGNHLPEIRRTLPQLHLSKLKKKIWSEFKDALLKRTEDEGQIAENTRPAPVPQPQPVPTPSYSNNPPAPTPIVQTLRPDEERRIITCPDSLPLPDPIPIEEKKYVYYRPPSPVNKYFSRSPSPVVTHRRRSPSPRRRSPSPPSTSRRLSPSPPQHISHRRHAPSPPTRHYSPSSRPRNYEPRSSRYHEATERTRGSRHFNPYRRYSPAAQHTSRHRSYQ